MYALIAAASKLLPFFRAIRTRTSRNCLVPSSLTIPKITLIRAFCQSSSRIFPGASSPSWCRQNVSINLMAAFAFFWLKKNFFFCSPSTISLVILQNVALRFRSLRHRLFLHGQSSPRLCMNFIRLLSFTCASLSLSMIWISVLTVLFAAVQVLLYSVIAGLVARFARPFT